MWYGSYEWPFAPSASFIYWRLCVAPPGAHVTHGMRTARPATDGNTTSSTVGRLIDKGVGQQHLCNAPKNSNPHLINKMLQVVTWCKWKPFHFKHGRQITKMPGVAEVTSHAIYFHSHPYKYIDTFAHTYSLSHINTLHTFKSIVYLPQLPESVIFQLIVL